MSNMTKTTTEIVDPEKIRERVLHYGARSKPVDFPMQNPAETDTEFETRKRGLRGVILGEIVKAFQIFDIEQGQRDEYRRLVLGFLTLPVHEHFRERSSKDLSPQLWHGLSKWQSKYSAYAGHFVQRDTFKDEVLSVLHRALWARGQQERFPSKTFGEILELWSYSPEWAQADFDGLEDYADMVEPVDEDVFVPYVFDEHSNPVVPGEIRGPNIDIVWIDEVGEVVLPVQAKPGDPDYKGGDAHWIDDLI